MNTITKAEKRIAKSDLVRQALLFWFADNNHIRSPFPAAIQPALEKQAVERFSQWIDHLRPQAKDDVNDEILAEKFEEILFEMALGMVKTEDERITLLYPFLPRLGDAVTRPGNGPIQSASRVMHRSLTTQGDQKFLLLKLEETAEGAGQTWETRMELPA